MQALYQYDIWARTAASDGGAPEGGGSADGPSKKMEAFDIDRLIDELTDDPDVRDFSSTLGHGALDSLETCDRLISKVAEKWKLDRIAAVDRAILRLAIFELNELREVPPKVVLNEAIELAKKFSTAQSGSFINGLLDRLLFLRDDEAAD